jgi:prevent-host-death family protein
VPKRRKTRHPQFKIYRGRELPTIPSGELFRIINQREFRSQSAAVLREVEAGATIVVTRNGTPVAELRPICARRFVPRATLSEGVTRAPRIDARRVRADLDTVIDQRLDDART